MPRKKKKPTELEEAIKASINKPTRRAKRSSEKEGFTAISLFNPSKNNGRDIKIEITFEKKVSQLGRKGELTSQLADLAFDYQMELVNIELTKPDTIKISVANIKEYSQRDILEFVIDIYINKDLIFNEKKNAIKEWKIIN